MARTWIQDAASDHKGAFTRQAKSAGKSVPQFAKEHALSPGTIGKRAILAEKAGRIGRMKK